ncbi:MAG: GNAT family N-acetyltransferase [Hyphomicrobium sp.]
MSADLVTRPAQTADLPAIAELHARALGPGRFARSAYRVREGTAGVTRFCRVGIREGRLVAALRMTEIVIGGREGALLLGPLAVDPDFAGQGFGRQLVTESIEEGRQAKQSLVVLVGDEPYYGRFGFKPVPAGLITFPGPVNPARVLALELETGALAAFRGPIVAR